MTMMMMMKLFLFQDEVENVPSSPDPRSAPPTSPTADSADVVIRVVTPASPVQGSTHQVSDST